MDILGSILSRLTFRESSGMGLVSHIWRRLWRSCCWKLVFTRATMFQPRNKSIKRTRTNFAMRVDSFLRQLHTHSPLDKFVIKFGLRRKHTCHVNRWIRFCSASRARHITIDFTPGVKGFAMGFAMGLANSKYIFPLNVFSGPDGSSTHVRFLHLGYVCLDTTSSGFMAFANLKKLTLHKISFLGGLQCLMLPEFNSLEWLSISYCSLPGLSTCQPLQRLRCVRLHYCYLKKIELEAPNLTSFDLTNPPIPFVLGASLKVMEANIKLLSYDDNLDYIYTELPAALSHVHKLSITSPLCIFDELQGFAKISARFINLRHLTMYLPLYGDLESIDGILRLAYLLELAPALEELELHANGGDVSVGWALRRNMLPYPHNKLKRVLISGAFEWEGLMELAYYILRSANRLECMILDPMRRIGGPPLDGWMVDRGREMIKEFFEGEEFRSILTIL
ncbi:hypothetical protein GQ55_5G434000 [Panicum hallii var. hallii]|uniref:At1g61320/AtMIF1 LRR domain-containing protein n=1 Tax=Panicum hallii var. hallii TaxID=1504633 RepID=A0A2T7DPF8_9POAL|nr:hypothetical protein GQ55_5G434000 [Panicum hallii var. hallii]